MPNDIVVNGNYVSVEYEGTFDDGEVFDSSAKHGGDPMAFSVGGHQVIEGFEKAVLGKKIGEEIKIRLLPAEAYGEYDSNAMQKVPKAQFGDITALSIGMMLQLQSTHEDHQHTQIAVIKKIGEEEITLDFNHPMAGKILNFKMNVVKIEECDPNAGCSAGCSCGH